MKLAERVRSLLARRPHKTRTLLQMEAVECGAAALGSILGYYGRIVPLEELRVRCGVSRDGVTAKNIIRAACGYGLKAKGYKRELKDLRTTRLPAILFWNFNHFLVLEGFVGDEVFLNDPGTGPRRVTMEEVDEAYTGVVLTFEPGPDFVPAGEEPSLVGALASRVRGSEEALLFAAIAGLVQFGGRVYTGAILRAGPTLRVRDAWRGTTSSEAGGTGAGSRSVRTWRRRLARATSTHHHRPARA